MILDYRLMGQRLAKCRKEKHVTQEQLAEYLDVSTAFISRIECGRTQINLERLVQICHFLETEPSYILQGADCASPVYMNGELSQLLSECPREALPLVKNLLEDVIAHFGRNSSSSDNASK